MKLLFIIMITMFSSQSNFQSLDKIQSHKQYEDRVEFKLSNALFNVYVIAPDLIRFRYTQNPGFSEAHSYAVISQNSVPCDFKISEEAEYFELDTSVLLVKITKNPCRVSIHDKDGRMINQDEPNYGVCFDHDEVRCFKKLLDNEQFYGLGEKTGGLGKRGNQYTMWNSDKPGYSMREDPLYASIPFFIGVRDHKAYGIFFDNTYRSYFNMGASNRRFYWFGADKGEMDYYFLYGPEIRKVISSYTALTGRMELPPLWALGYQQSKWSYYPESTVRTLAKNFRNKGIPCDVIYLDIHYMNEYRVFTWNKERFPNPEKMLDDLRGDGFKIVPIIDPGVKADLGYFAAQEGVKGDFFAKYPDGDIYQGEVWPSWAYFPDFTKKETREWWGEKLSALMKQGVSGFWNDMNEPAVWGQAFPDLVEFDDNGFKANHKKIHNVYGLQMAKATFDGLKKFFPEKRPFILTRAGFSGVQRYASMWTGDNVASEDHLRLACIMPQGIGLSGIPFIGTDVGGFIGNPSQRLYTRWMQLGTFTPFFRGHSATGQQDKEPWAFGEDTERLVKEAIFLRYRMLLFLYNEFYNSTQSGLPIMRPMFLNYQDDDECYSWDAQFQFMLGQNLLVAPVLSEHDNFKKLYLPQGKWLDLWDAKVYEGNRWIIVDAPLSRIPLFIAQGGIIPIQEARQFVGEKNLSELELMVFPSSLSSYPIYEDDGVTCDYQKGVFTMTNFTLARNGGEISLKIDKVHKAYDTKRENYLIRFFDCDKFSKVEVNDVELQKCDSEKGLKSVSEGYCLDQDKKSIIVKVKDRQILDIKIK